MSATNQFLPRDACRELLSHVRAAASAVGVSLPELKVSQERGYEGAYAGQSVTVIHTTSYVPERRLQSVRDKIDQRSGLPASLGIGPWRFASPPKPAAPHFIP
jgi:hypothetical protein